MTTRQLLKEVSTELQNLGILGSPGQALGFLKAWQDEDPEVIECLADCVANHSDWLYGWLTTSQQFQLSGFTALRWLMLENKPMLAVDNFFIYIDMSWQLCAPA